MRPFYEININNNELFIIIFEYIWVPVLLILKHKSILIYIGTKNDLNEVK